MCMASPIFRGTKLTRHSHYLDVVFLLCFLPEFWAQGNRKTAGGRRGTKTSVFLPPRASHQASNSSQAQHTNPVGRTSMAEVPSNLSDTVRRAALAFALQ